MRRRNLLVLLFISFIVSVKAQTTADGIKAMEYENYATARRILSGLVKSSPADPLNYYYLGVVYCNLGKIDSARAVFTAGTQADPKSIYNYDGLGRTYLEENNTQQATQNFDKAKSLTSQKDVTQYKLVADAYSSAAHPNYDMAVSLLNKAIEYTNKDPEVYWILGKTYEAMTKSGDAVSAYERSTELNPSYAKSFVRMGVIWDAARNKDLSMENYNKAMKADPNFPPTYRELAEHYFLLAKYDLACENSEKYMSMADKDENRLYRRAQFLFLCKKYKEAMDILNTLKTKSDLPILYRLQGYSNYEIGNYREGLQQMKTFFEKMDSAKVIPSDYEYLGKLQIKSGMDSIGYLTIEKAIRRDSSKYELYDTIAVYLFKQKKYEQAAKYYDKKVKAMPSSAPFRERFNTLFSEGKSFYFGHNYVKSDSVFMSLQKLSPDWAVSYLFRARAQLFIDSLDTARGKAFPFYNLFISKAFSDTVHFKSELAEAYQYLGNYNTHYRNYGAGLYYFNKAIDLNGGNEDINATVKALKDSYKTPPGSSIPATKDSAGYLIPAVISGHSLTVLYDPGIMGIGVTQEGSSQLSGTGSDGDNSKGVIVKIGDHSVKNVTVTVIPDEKKPIAVGADVLNKMNIVFDYPSGSLLQR